MYGEGGAPGTVPLHNPESHLTLFFTKRCPSGGTEYVCFELFLGALGRGEGAPWYGTFVKPRSHFTEGMFEKRWFRHSLVILLIQTHACPMAPCAALVITHLSVHHVARPLAAFGRPRACARVTWDNDNSEDFSSPVTFLLVSRARKPWSANRELRGWQKRGCRDRCQERPKKGA